jgi:hypothetical protein
MELVALFLAMVLVTAVAAAVLVYVAYPHRGRQPRHARWVSDLVARISGPVRVHDDVHDQALLAAPGIDDDMTARLRRVERVVTAGLAGRD